MKERLNQLLDLEHLSPSKFADLIGVQRSSVSHVLSGRNKPSFDFLEKTLRAFPGLEADWLILGKGTMYEKMGRSGDMELFGDESALSTPPQSDFPSVQEEAEPQEMQGDDQPGTPLEDAKDVERELVKVILFYDDHTFTTYTPSK